MHFPKQNSLNVDEENYQLAFTYHMIAQIFVQFAAGYLSSGAISATSSVCARIVRIYWTHLTSTIVVGIQIRPTWADYNVKQF